MRKGGYKIIDLEDKNITLEGQVTIKGIHEKIEANYRKAYLLSGIKLDGSEIQDQFFVIEIKSQTYQ